MTTWSNGLRHHRARRSLAILACTGRAETATSAPRSQRVQSRLTAANADRVRPDATSRATVHLVPWLQSSLSSSPWRRLRQPSLLPGTVCRARHWRPRNRLTSGDRGWSYCLMAPATARAGHPTTSSARRAQGPGDVFTTQVFCSNAAKLAPSTARRRLSGRLGMEQGSQAGPRSRLRPSDERRRARCQKPGNPPRGFAEDRSQSERRSRNGRRVCRLRNRRDHGAVEARRHWSRARVGMARRHEQAGRAPLPDAEPSGKSPAWWRARRLTILGASTPKALSARFDARSGPGAFSDPKTSALRPAEDGGIWW